MCECVCVLCSVCVLCANHHKMEQVSPVVSNLTIAFIIITDSIIILYHVTVPIQICVVVINFARFYNFV